MVAINKRTREVLAVGDTAKNDRQDLGYSCNKTMKDGVIADFEVTQSMLKYFIESNVQRDV